MEFPSSLTSTERAFIHRMAQSLGYISKSRGYVTKNTFYLICMWKKGLSRNSISVFVSVCVICIQPLKSFESYNNSVIVILNTSIVNVEVQCWPQSFIMFCRKGSNRFLTIRKKDGSETAQSIMTFSLGPCSKQVIRNLLQRFPMTNKEITDLLPRTERGMSVAVEAGGQCLFYQLLSMHDDWHFFLKHYKLGKT